MSVAFKSVDNLSAYISIKLQIDTILELDGIKHPVKTGQKLNIYDKTQ